MKFPSPGALRPNKTWVILGIALSIGVLAALAARSFLSDRIASIEARGKGPTVAVVVAKRDMPKGTLLTADNVAVRPVPQEFAHSVAVLPTQFDRIEGQSIAYPLKAGETIMWGLMESKKVPTFSARVEAGHRAMTVPVDEINSISGLLEPGDSIDLMVTVDHSGKKITFPLLQSVLVMATGQRAADDPQTGERRNFTTVTLDTTPEQAQNVIVAREAGKITALLRNPSDRKPMAGTRADMAALLGLGRSGPRNERDIPVLYGGSIAKLPPEALRLEPRTRADVNPLLDPMQAGRDTLKKMQQDAPLVASAKPPPLSSPAPLSSSVPSSVSSSKP
ncbi:Flp pilus assembly protein CpaB [Actimicrobium antarcticum]|uniref:Flp pilus assembly protein CpaB n=1 Tax=Actimicrobium antarcticum TaxID=1051899 RepID=A0ABP7SP73_9BURK